MLEILMVIPIELINNEANIFLKKIKDINIFLLYSSIFLNCSINDSFLLQNKKI